MLAMYLSLNCEKTSTWLLALKSSHLGSIRMLFADVIGIISRNS